jgi:putative transposase
VPGGTFLITRTTVMSLFLLLPSKVVNNAMEYCMAWAARDKGILIHAICVESSHFHMVVTDPRGLLSDFMQEFDRCTARCILAYYRSIFPNTRFDALFSPAESFCDTLLVNAAAVLDKLVYTFVNPVKDGLVRDYRKWPGFHTRPSDWRKGTRTVKRPDFYFKHTPKTLSYSIVPPTQLGQTQACIELVERYIRDAQQQAAIDIRADGRSFAGVKAVLRRSPLDSPSTQRPRGRLTPSLAACGDAKAMTAAAIALKFFRIQYREAWRAYKDGLRGVLFPGGTLLMARRHQCPCADLDLSWCQLGTG